MGDLRAATRLTAAAADRAESAGRIAHALEHRSRCVTIAVLRRQGADTEAWAGEGSSGYRDEPPF
jgi:hypothetical protein